MPFPIHSTLLVDASAAATGSAAVTMPDKWVVHRFYASISAAATVRIQASADGGTTWFDLTAAPLTASNLAIIDRPYKNLRVSWTGNTGSLTVRTEQLGMPIGWMI